MVSAFIGWVLSRLGRAGRAMLMHLNGLRMTINISMETTEVEKISTVKILILQCFRYKIWFPL
jgi:hypothetical protein